MNIKGANLTFEIFDLNSVEVSIDYVLRSLRFADLSGDRPAVVSLELLEVLRDYLNDKDIKLEKQNFYECGYIKNGEGGVYIKTIPEDIEVYIKDDYEYIFIHKNSKEFVVSNYQMDHALTLGFGAIHEVINMLKEEIK